MTRPIPRMVYNRKSERQDIQDLNACRRDPAAVARLVSEFQVNQELKKRGVLRSYVRVGGAA